MVSELRLCPASRYQLEGLSRRNPQTKKHKTWDGDGVLVASSKYCILLDLENRKYVWSWNMSALIFSYSDRIVQGKPDFGDASKLGVGSQLVLGGKELEIDCAISKDDYNSGRCFTRGGASTPPPTIIRNSGSSTKQFVPLRPHSASSAYRPPSLAAKQSSSTVGSSARAVVNAVTVHASHSEAITSSHPYWTVNWCADTFHMIRPTANLCPPGGSHKARRTRRGTVMGF